ncbi:type I-F CRISPR-associated helicase Cas3f [Orbaceae bacterium ESL0727]|nr:type I-F CRISPR-associated helicase Cas3f [Orbaceae bacterium ESL0727]
MNILLISQCQKKALTETRRIIDQFAERCGDRVWQTVITEAGLHTLHKLLRQRARKNSAIACYWTHGKNQTDLLWIVGDRSKFNQQGRVPTNRTQRNILRCDSENHWQYATTIQLVTTIAALLHDLGKATIGFQTKLRAATRTAADPFRHEWISLQLFILMIRDCQSNEAMLYRLANFADYQKQNPHWYRQLSITENNDLTLLPALARWIGWLIVSHHRMPFLMPVKSNDIKRLQKQSLDIADLTEQSFFHALNAVDGWVKNSFSEHTAPHHFWQLKADVTQSEVWLKKLNRYATKALRHPPLMALTTVDSFLLHTSRLILMVADHNYSSLPFINNTAKQHDKLIANTNSHKEAKQCLDEHLLGVANLAARFARLLPQLSTILPTIHQHKAFTRRVKTKCFQWQDSAFDLAKCYQSQADDNGFFGVNMASTGCGKTLANGRIMYALSHPDRGARFTIALGLRVLTLQTGQALRDRLQLSNEQLAILVGGKATQTLFDLNDEAKQKASSAPLNNQTQYDDWGAESAESFIDEFVDVAASGIADEELGTIIDNPKARQLLYAPIVSCTVDHLMQASECLRGGKYIAPTLRLLSADLILDEPDDFDQNDLPALARLVYLAGLWGSKVLLSSATLTPDLIVGLFDAYQAGRRIWQHNCGSTAAPHTIICGWFDEYVQSIVPVSDSDHFRHQHQGFVSDRVAHLAQCAVRRQGEILALLNYQTDKKENDSLNYTRLAKQIVTQAHQFHLAHAESDPLTHKTVSIGLVRFAHTDDLIAIAQQIYQQIQPPEETALHIVVYHARQLLLLRSQLEEKLDRLLNRSVPEKLFTQPEVRDVLDSSPYQQHIFIVLGTPVTEVGRDHDYDWAIVEPSSMRSIIQLVGRVWRHRPQKVASVANVAMLGSNLNALKYGADLGVTQGKSCFEKPGFEAEDFLLASHKSQDIILPEQLSNINAIPRIQCDNKVHEPSPALSASPQIKRATPILPAKKRTTRVNHTLAELEHHVMAHLFAMPDGTVTANKSNYVTSYWQTGLAHHYCSHLQLISPFRQQNYRERDYVCQLDDEDNYQFCLADIAWQTPDHGCREKQNHLISYQSWGIPQPAVSLWLVNSVAKALSGLASLDKFSHTNRYRLANEFCTVSLDENYRWLFNPNIGFYRHKS